MQGPSPSPLSPFPSGKTTVGGSSGHHGCHNNVCKRGKSKVGTKYLFENFFKLLHAFMPKQIFWSKAYFFQHFDSKSRIFFEQRLKNLYMSVSLQCLCHCRNETGPVYLYLYCRPRPLFIFLIFQVPCVFL